MLPNLPRSLPKFDLPASLPRLDFKESRSFLREFRDFAIKGNVIDLAVGVIIGGAFGKIVTSLVNDIIMPPIGLLTSGVDFASKVWVLKPAIDAAHPAVTINYGVFINNIITFLIVAFCVFIMVKEINKL